MPEKIFRANIIAITGHRDYPDRGNLYRGLDRLKANHYLFGGARGVDSDALEYLGKTQPGTRRTVVVPNRLSDQPLSSQRITKRWSTNVIELKHPGKNRFQLRNQYLVDKSNHTRAFFDFRKSGGTYNTIQYARQKGKSLDVWSLKKFNQDDILKKSPREFRSWVGNMKNLRVNLSAVKMLIINFILRVLKTTLRMFLESLGYAGVKTLEELWSL